MGNSGEPRDLSLGDRATRGGGLPAGAPAEFRDAHDGTLGDRATALQPGSPGAPVVPGTFAVGEVLDGQFRLLRLVGQGGMGAVFEAEDLRLGRRVAIKCLLGRTLHSRRGIERFLREARAIAGLSHAGIVPVFGLGEAGGLPFIVMRYIDGGTLLDRLRRDGQVPGPAALEIARALCEALAHAHARGVIHRDVKPGNVLLDPDGRPVLGDFGLALQVAESELTLTGEVLGTFDYMAPEQRAAATAVDARADQFALAATLYHALTGEVPRRIRESRLPAAWRRPLLKALEEDPTARFADLRGFRAALEESLAGAENALRVAVPSADEPCAGCGTVNPVGVKHCVRCGKDLAIACASCGKKVGHGQERCGECGFEARRFLQLEWACRASDRAGDLTGLRAAARALVEAFPGQSRAEQWKVQATAIEEARRALVARDGAAADQSLRGACEPSCLAPELAALVRADRDALHREFLDRCRAAEGAGDLERLLKEAGAFAGAFTGDPAASEWADTARALHATARSLAAGRGTECQAHLARLSATTLCSAIGERLRADVTSLYDRLLSACQEADATGDARRVSTAAVAFASAFGADATARAWMNASEKLVHVMKALADGSLGVAEAYFEPMNWDEREARFASGCRARAQAALVAARGVERRGVLVWLLVGGMVVTAIVVASFLAS